MLLPKALPNAGLLQRISEVNHDLAVLFLEYITNYKL